jgi:hypothetical protein
MMECVVEGKSLKRNRQFSHLLTCPIAPAALSPLESNGMTISNFRKDFPGGEIENEKSSERGKKEKRKEGREGEGKEGGKERRKEGRRMKERECCNLVKADDPWLT